MTEKLSQENVEAVETLEQGAESFEAAQEAPVAETAENIAVAEAQAEATKAAEASQADAIKKNLEQAMSTGPESKAETISGESLEMQNAKLAKLNEMLDAINAKRTGFMGMLSSEKQLKANELTVKNAIENVKTGKKPVDIVLIRDLANLKSMKLEGFDEQKNKIRSYGTHSFGSGA